MKSAVTVSLVEQARGGPFVFWDNLPAACRSAAQLGFDAVELFAPSPDVVSESGLRSLLNDTQLKLAAVGTGAGWLIKKLSLTSADPSVREQAIDFIKAMIDFGGNQNAPAIIGSMQGRWGEGVDRKTALTWLADALRELGEHARQYNVPLFYEPLNRYETNLCNTVSAGLDLLENVGTEDVKLLCDLFHMNVEESDISAALRQAGPRLGHIHFVDSNRWAAGAGHLEFGSIMHALRETGYAGYLSAEALSLPDAQSAAIQTIKAFRYWTAPRTAINHP